MTKPDFSWDEVRRDADGKVVLLYRHERVLHEPFWPSVHDVLDVGGWGVLATRLLEEGRACTVLDLFTEDQYYPDRVRALPHVVGDVRDASLFAPRSFDLVTCFETLEHVGDVPAALYSVGRWLRPGGWFVGTVPVAGYCHQDGEVGVEILSRERLVGLLAAAGFSDVRVEPTRSVGLLDEPECCLYFTACAPSVPHMSPGVS